MACFTIELVCVRGEWFITEPRALNEIQPSHTARYGTKCIRNPVGHETESPRGVMGVAPGARQCARECPHTVAVPVAVGTKRAPAPQRHAS